MDVPIVGKAAPAPLGTVPQGGKQEDPEKIRTAARDFEALLIGQMLHSMRGDGQQGWLGTGEDEAGTRIMDLAEEQFAHALSTSGGLGLARMIVKGLNTAPATKNSSRLPRIPAVPKPEARPTEN
jgi:Rod binding domain-containing protein